MLRRPQVEGAQSRAQLITDLARREKLTVRQLIGGSAAAAGTAPSAAPRSSRDTIQDWFGAADGFN